MRSQWVNRQEFVIVVRSGRTRPHLGALLLGHYAVAASFSTPCAWVREYCQESRPSPAAPGAPRRTNATANASSRLGCLGSASICSALSAIRTALALNQWSPALPEAWSRPPSPRKPGRNFSANAAVSASSLPFMQFCAAHDLRGSHASKPGLTSDVFWGGQDGQATGQGQNDRLGLPTRS
jgi:hypothetical protein